MLSQEAMLLCAGVADDGARAARLQTVRDHRVEQLLPAAALPRHVSQPRQRGSEPQGVHRQEAGA